MTKIDIGTIDRILRDEDVFGIDIDSQVRAAANRMTAKAFLEFCRAFNFSAVTDPQAFAAALSQVSDGSEISGFIGFDYGTIPSDEDDELPEFPENGVNCFLRLIFRDEIAAYYQFPLFPALDETFIMSSSRKREGHCQHLRIELIHRKYLQPFLERLRENPHLIGIEDSSEETFDAAPSHGV